MSFESELGDFEKFFERRLTDVATLSLLEVQRSVVFGSELTGAPGQPVDTGALRASWLLERISKLLWRLTSGLSYAQAIEDGMGPHGPISLKSPVGGFGSVAATEQSWQRIVEHVNQRLAA